MRVAFVGKGGAGKSVLAGTAARLLGRAGRRVLAVDSDPLPGLALSLGLADATASLPEEAWETYQLDGRTRTRLRISPSEAIEKYARQAPDGVRLLTFGKVAAGSGPRALWAAQSAFQEILDALPALDWTVVGDLPGGTRQPFFGWGRYASHLLVVVEPSPAGLLTARRLARLADSRASPRLAAVLNKVRPDDDVAELTRRCPLEVLGVVRAEEAVRAADRAGRPLLDVAPEAAAVAAVGSLVARLAEEVPW